jgi:hypothetical protein
VYTYTKVIATLLYHSFTNNNRVSTHKILKMFGRDEFGRERREREGEFGGNMGGGMGGGMGGYPGEMGGGMGGGGMGGFPGEMGGGMGGFPGEMGGGMGGGGGIGGEIRRLEREI